MPGAKGRGRVIGAKKTTRRKIPATGLQSPNPIVRLRAVTSIEKRLDAERIPLLARIMLVDENPKVRQRASDALANIAQKKPDAATSELMVAANQLLGGLRHRDPIVRLNVVRALGSMKGIKKHRELAKALEYRALNDKNLLVRKEAVSVLGLGK